MYPDDVDVWVTITTESSGKATRMNQKRHVGG